MDRSTQGKQHLRVKQKKRNIRIDEREKTDENGSLLWTPNCEDVLPDLPKA